MAQSIFATDAGVQSLVVETAAERNSLTLPSSIAILVAHDGAAWVDPGDPLAFLARAIVNDPSIFNHSRPENGFWLGVLGFA